jgi:transcriptional regulator with XRE-family HTH domain
MARKDRDLSQADLAQLIGRSQRWVSRVENSERVSLADFETIGRGLGFNARNWFLFYLSERDLFHS